MCLISMYNDNVSLYHQSNKCRLEYLSVSLLSLLEEMVKPLGVAAEAPPAPAGAAALDFVAAF